LKKEFKEKAEVKEWHELFEKKGLNIDKKTYFDNFHTLKSSNAFTANKFSDRLAAT